MPRLNKSKGNVASGSGGHQGSVDRTLVSNALGPHWLNADEIVFPTFDGKIAKQNPYIGSPTVEVAPRGCNDLRADGDVWAAWLAGYGLFASTGWHDPLAGLQAVGPEGQIGYTPNRQEGLGCNVRLITGETWRLSDGVVYDLQLLSNFRAIWTFQNNVYVHGMPPPALVPGGVWLPKFAEIGGQGYLCYFSSAQGVIVHKYEDASQGWVFAGPGINAYNHDMIAINGLLEVCASSGAGENPSEWWMVYYDPATTPMVPFGAAPVYPITAINKKMYLAFFSGFPAATGGWDTNDDPVGPWPPGNAFLEGDSTSRALLTPEGQRIGTYIVGGSVEEIEAKAAACTDIPVCYWDSRRWPRMPNLPDGAWLCGQAYRNASEPIANFEADILSILQMHIAERPNLKHVSVPQCYTSNSDMTTDLKSVVSVISRIASALPLHAILPFSGNGRKTGLQDHPEVRPLWEELFSTITGVPDEGGGGNGGNGGGSMDWGTIHQYGVDRWAELEVQAKSQQLVDQGLECRDFQKDCFVKIASELYHEKGIPLELFWKAGIPEYGNAQDVKEKLRFIGEDIIVDRPESGYKDVVVSMGIPSAHWNASGGLNPVQGSDLNRCGRPPDLEGGPPDPPDPPEPGTVSVTIYRYDQTFHRGGPGSEYGMEIVFEVGPFPIVEVQGGLDDGSPLISPQFPDPTPGKPDGSYYRGFRFKPTINGEWYPIVRARNAQGVWGEARGETTVVVTSIA